MQARINKKIIVFLALMLVSVKGLAMQTFEHKLELLENDSVYVEAKADFELFTQNLYRTLNDTTLSYGAFEYAAKGYFNLLRKNKISKDRLFTVIDFSKPSTD